MGWNSARDIFDPIAQALIDAGAPDEMKTRVLGELIGNLQDEDWDTEGESLELFRNDPAIVEAFRQHDVILPGGDDGDGTADQLEEARDLARALHAAALENCEYWDEVSAYDVRLTGERLPYWLTNESGAPLTWQRDGEASPGQ